MYKEIMEVKNKSCKLDIIPTTLLKEMLPACLHTITQIVNLTLTNGDFNEEWKTTIVRPLLEKFGVELIHKSMDHCNKKNCFQTSNQPTEKTTVYISQTPQCQWQSYTCNPWSEVFGRIFGPVTKLKRICKTKGKEGNVKPCKNQINQEIPIHRGLHYSSFNAVHSPSRLWKHINLQPAKEDNMKIPTYSKHLYQAGIKAI